MSIVNIEELLRTNTYPGRGIVLGMSADAKNAVAAYFIMGRSENSRNRVFIEEGEELRTKAFDESKLSDPSLIIYYPVRKAKNKLIVTNGDQTDTIRDYINDGKCFGGALKTRCFEPDAPNFTPRISGMIDFGDSSFTYKMSILKSADEAGSACSRYTFDYEPLCGKGHFIHTYRSDGSPIPSFEGEPREIKIPDSIDSFADSIWSSLNDDNKVSLFVRYVNIESKKAQTRIINKNK